MPELYTKTGRQLGFPAGTAYTSTEEIPVIKFPNVPSRRLFPAFVLASAVALAAIPAAAQSGERSAPAPGTIEFGFWGGAARARTLGSTVYQDAWTTFLGTSIAERTAIDVRTKGVPVFGASLTWFFHSHTGVQLWAGYAGSQTTADALMEFGWTLADGSALQRSASLASAAGRMTSVPVCLNFVERLVFGRWRIDVSAGPAFFFHELRQDSAFGYSVVDVSPAGGRPDLPPDESYDAISVPLRIPRTSWSSWGWNAGAGLRFQAGARLAFAAEARCFSSPEKSLRWNALPGKYDGMFTSGFRGEPFGAEELASLTESGQTFALKVKPSFFLFSFGVLFTFGR